MSVVLGPYCYGTRSAVAMPVLPEAAIDLVRDASATIFAPMTAADRAFVSGMLDVARNSILMLSEDQLRDPAACLELMSRASVTVLNEGELHQLLGFAGEDVVRREFQMYGITAVVTSRHDATAYVGGRVVSRAAFQATARRTVGAGDVFVGTLAVGVVQGKPWSEILDDALAACCLHVESANITDVAMGVQASRQRVVCEPATSRRAALARLLPAVSLGTAAALALLMLAVG